MFGWNVVLSVMVVAIAVGLLYLTWKQYQQPAHFRVTRMTDEMIRAYLDSRVLYGVCAALCILSVAASILILIWNGVGALVVVPFAVTSVLVLGILFLAEMIQRHEFCRPTRSKKTTA